RGLSRGTVPARRTGISASDRFRWHTHCHKLAHGDSSVSGAANTLRAHVCPAGGGRSAGVAAPLAHQQLLDASGGIFHHPDVHPQRGDDTAVDRAASAPGQGAYPAATGGGTEAAPEAPRTHAPVARRLE